MLKIENVTKYYGDVLGIENISLENKNHLSHHIEKINNVYNRLIECII